MSSPDERTSDAASEPRHVSFESVVDSFGGQSYKVPDAPAVGLRPSLCGREVGRG